MRNKTYIIEFTGLWLGGVAVVKAPSKQLAWEDLKGRWASLEPIEQCTFKDITKDTGVIYFDNGDY